MKILSTALLLGIIGLLYVPSSLGASTASNEVFYADQQLTANLQEANLKEVLSAVAKVANVEFTIDKAIADKKVSIQFNKLSLEKGIKKILRPFNHSMIFNSSGQPEKIIIIESGSKSTIETITKDQNFSLSIALNQQEFDPSFEPGGRLEEDLPENFPGGPGPMVLDQQEFDPSLGPGGPMEEELPEGSAGGPGGEMHIPVAGVDYDSAIGPTGQLEEVLPESTTGPRGPQEEMAVLSEKEQFDPSLGSNGQSEPDLPENAVGPVGSLSESRGTTASMAK